MKRFSWIVLLILGFTISCNDANFPRSHDGLSWSKPYSLGMTWKAAKEYCENLGGRLPAISELRILIKNCPKTELAGPCGVTTKCLQGICWNKNNKGCTGCVHTADGKYSVFGDKIVFWSSSALFYRTSRAWYVDFSHGGVNHSRKTRRHSFICVK